VDSGDERKPKLRIRFVDENVPSDLRRTGDFVFYVEGRVFLDIKFVTHIQDKETVFKVTSVQITKLPPEALEACYECPEGFHSGMATVIILLRPVICFGYLFHSIALPATPELR
jgi:hypothetical protein